MQRERAERIQSCGIPLFSFADSIEGFLVLPSVAEQGGHAGALWELGGDAGMK
jgi:hypothetical protein